MARTNDEETSTPPNSTRPREAPATTYSRVGRRSSPGIPAVPVGPIIAVPPPSRSSTNLVAAPKVAALPPPLPNTSPLPAPVPPRIPTTVGMPVARVETVTVARAERDPETEGPATEKITRPPLSVRPPAPEPFAAAAENQSIAQTFDRLLGRELESSFTEMKADGGNAEPTVVPPGEAPLAGLGEVRALFGQLAVQHARPVRDFLIDLKWGEASREWVGICSPAVGALRRAAEKLELAELLTAIDAFDAALTLAGAESSPVIEGAARDGLLVAHDALAAALPDAFALEMDHAQREAMIVQSLLLQIPDVRKATLEHLYAAGLTTVAALAAGSAEDVASTAGIAPKIAQRIVDKFRAYKGDLQSSTLDATRAYERSRIAELTSELAAQHEGYEQASAAWSKEAEADKKRMRRMRHRTLMEITVLLARLGEVARLRDLERLPYDRKLDELRAFASQPAHAYGTYDAA